MLKRGWLLIAQHTLYELYAGWFNADAFIAPHPLYEYKDGFKRIRIAAHPLYELDASSI